MDEKKIEELVYSKKVIEFLTVANEYCVFTENCEKYTKEDIYMFYQKVIPLLYLKAALLPKIETEDNAALEHFVNEEKWQDIYKLLKEKFVGEDEMFLIDDEAVAAKSADYAKSSMAEKLADSYQDLKDFVMLYQKGTHAAKENALNDCKDLFENHWGIRLLDVHRHLHKILYQSNSPSIEME